MVSHVHSSALVVFHDPTYPLACSDELLQALLPAPFETVDAHGLAQRLESGCRVLLSFHGSYFPKMAWVALRSFLQSGGNLAIFGGMPFTHPVTDNGAVEPEQDTYTRQLYLGPFFEVTPHDASLRFVAAEGATFLEDCPLNISTEQAGLFWACYPKLTQTSDHPEEMGSAGPLDTALEPLLFATIDTAFGEERIATPAWLMEQHAGQFRGGRWLISAWRPATEDVWLTHVELLRRLITLACEPLTMLAVRPALACYQPGETPTLLINARTPRELHISLHISGPQGEIIVEPGEISFGPASYLQERRIALHDCPTPGLYRVVAEYHSDAHLRLQQETGFWLWDASLIEATQQKRLSAGRDHFYQQGQPVALFGTTYMDGRVQRKFLHLPNPARWDNEIAAIRAAGMNVIRTGIWTSWRDFVALSGVANEAFLRALDAFVLTICKHDIHLIFTFFSFFPPMYEGENPWLDPRALEAQQDFVSLLAQRYAAVELLAWDLINEPSFGDPARIFSQRPIPNYDHFEQASFQHWLKQRYSLAELQLRWRQTPTDMPTWQHVTPPVAADYSTSVRDNSYRHMLKAADYTHYSQEMFSVWAQQMRQVIHASGSRTLVGVGQDEAGARLAPQFYASAVDYTTTHPWWNNDALLWDMLMDKTLHKPNLIQEAGVMLVSDVDGRPWRSEEQAAHLLERKVTLSLVARSAGFIQWLWHTNSNMTSDNENSIGLVRADGSAKPELTVMRASGRLMQEIAASVIEEALPSLWLVIPYSQWFVRPELGIEATQHAVRLLGYDLGIIPQLIGEQQLHSLPTLAQQPEVIIVPGAQLVDETLWATLRQFVYEGGTVLVSGVLSRSQHNLPITPLLPEMQDDEHIQPVSRYEFLETESGEQYRLIFEGDKIGYIKKAHNQLKDYRYGAGQVIWSGLPLELSASSRATRHVYQGVINHAPTVGQTACHSSRSVLVARRHLKDGSLVLVVSEAGSTQQVTLDEGIEITVAPNRAGAVVVKDEQITHVFGGLTATVHAH